MNNFYFITFWSSASSSELKITGTLPPIHSPMIWWNFSRDVCFCRETSDFTSLRFVACQDFESVCFIYRFDLSDRNFKNTDKITNYKCGVVCNDKFDIKIVRLLEKAILYFREIQFGGRNRWQGD